MNDQDSESMTLSKFLFQGGIIEINRSVEADANKP